LVVYEGIIRSVPTGNFSIRPNTHGIFNITALIIMLTR